MNEVDLKNDVANGLSTREIAIRRGCSQTNVRYWLRKYGVKSSHKRGWPSPPTKPRRPCELCGNTKRKGRLCGSCYTKVRRHRLKRAMVDYKGGKCEEKTCGWSGKVEGFDFHHPDDNKEFAIADAYCRSVKAIKAEVDKCTMLCSRCHRLEHATDLSAEMIAEIEKRQIDLGA